MVHVSKSIKKLTNNVNLKRKSLSESRKTGETESGKEDDVNMSETSSSSSISLAIDETNYEQTDVDVVEENKETGEKETDENPEVNKEVMTPSNVCNTLAQTVSYFEWTSQKRFSHRHLFLTWSDNKSKLSKDIIVKWIEEEYPGSCYVICEEPTKAGKPHYHALLSSPTYYDLRGKHRLVIDVKGKKHYPYVISPKTPQDIGHVIWYIKKTDKRVIYKGYTESDAVQKKPKEGGFRPLKELDEVCRGRTLEEAMTIASERGYDERSVSNISKMHQIVGKTVSIAESICLDTTPFKGDYYFSQAIKRHCELYIGWNGNPPKYPKNNGRIPILLVVGPPWMNKTSMVRSLGAHLYFQGSGITLQDFSAECEIPSEVKYVVIDDASGLFKEEKTYDKFGKALLQAKGDFRAHLKNLTHVKCSNQLPVIWIQNSNTETYRFWERNEFSDWMIDSTCVEMYPLTRPHYENIQNRYRDKLMGHASQRGQALKCLTVDLTEAYNPAKYGKEVLQVFSLNKDLRKEAIETIVRKSLEGKNPAPNFDSALKNFEARLYKGTAKYFKKPKETVKPEEEIDKNELGVYVQWESLPTGEEETYTRYYRMESASERALNVYNLIVEG